MYTAINDFLICFNKSGNTDFRMKLPFQKWNNSLQSTSEQNFIFDGTIYTNKDDIEQSLIDRIGNFENAISGEYSFIAINDNKLYAGTDPLGAETLFYIDDDNFFCLSNSFEMIYNFCKDEVDYSFDSYAFLNAMFFGFSFYPTTSIKQIKLLNFNEYIIIDRLERSVKIVESNYFDFICDVGEKKITYGDLLESCISTLKQNTAQCINHTYDNNRRLVLELTAGKDSRVVLAALLANGFTDFSLRTFGASTSKDFCFSSLIATLFNLEYVEYETDVPLLDGVKKYAIHSAGVYRLIDATFASNSLKSDYSIMTGCYGEMSRGYYDKQLFKKIDIDVVRFKHQYSPADKFILLPQIFALYNFSTAEQKQYIANCCHAFYGNFPLQDALYYVLDYIFVFSRARFHFGQTLHFRNRQLYPSYAITNTPLYHALSFALSFEERISDINIYNCINRLYSPLCYIEYEQRPLFYDKYIKNSHLHELIKIPNAPLKSKNIPSTSRGNTQSVDYSEIEKIFISMVHDDRFSGLINYDQIKRFLISKNKTSILRSFAGLLYYYNQYIIR